MEIEIIVEWVPGHEGVPGNEKADEMAGEATDLPSPNPQIYSISHLRRKVRENTLQEWQHRFTDTERNTEYTGKPSLSLPKEFRTNFKKNYKARRDTTTPIIHLRTGHGYFKSYFRRFNIELANHTCSCGEDNQTRTHLLLACNTYKDYRQILINNNPNKQWTSHSLLHTEEGLKKTLAFVSATGVATRGWFTKSDQSDTDPDDTENTTWTNLDIGMGKIAQTQ
jgi:hypothetical protein